MDFGTELNGSINSLHLIFYLYRYILLPAMDGLWYRAKRTRQQLPFNVLYADYTLSPATNELWYRVE
jgi:hypothetical protein